MNFLKLVENYVTSYYEEFSNNNFAYHNICHVHDVVSMSEKIGNCCNLNKIEKELLKIAAWFHDIGHFTSKDNHEIISAKLAKGYLEKVNYPPREIELILGCIIATDITVKPRNLLEEIIKDADLFHLGSKCYLKYCDKLYEEVIKRNICSIDYNTWTKSSIKLFEEHQYFTECAKKMFTEQKMVNLDKLYSVLKNNPLYNDKNN